MARERKQREKQLLLAHLQVHPLNLTAVPSQHAHLANFASDWFSPWRRSVRPHSEMTSKQRRASTPKSMSACKRRFV